MAGPFTPFVAGAAAVGVTAAYLISRTLSQRDNQSDAALPAFGTRIFSATDAPRSRDQLRTRPVGMRDYEMNLMAGIPCEAEIYGPHFGRKRAPDSGRVAGTSV
ncbi:hypothetical protein BC832DRAFT_612014 [Gaertneriomyces semiglobifer]|nr:hypothetical protein BC832DRAFT_612014 [Gaertneriomyces semiglobifer]